MKIAIDPTDHHQDDVFYCKTKADWDNSQFSYKTFERLKKEKFEGKHNGMPLIVAQREPYKFPCIAVEGGEIQNGEHRRERCFSFIYNFEIIEE